MEIKDIEFLADFFKKINSKNNDTVDLDAFMLEEDTSYSFEEDIIENLKEYPCEFDVIINNLK